MNNFEIKAQPMLCASTEAEKRKYNLYRDKHETIQLVADQPNAGDNIYVEGGPGSCGFDNRIINFELITGEIIKLEGPWKFNSTILFNATGIDVRNKHKTWGCIGTNWIPGPGFMGTIIDVIYMDNNPVIGVFNRIKNLANNHAKKLGVDVYYYSQNQDGSTQQKTRLYNEVH